MLVEILLDFVEFLASLPVWGEIWCLGVIRRDAPTKRRSAQIAFGTEFLVLLVAALVGLTLDLTVEGKPFYYLWLCAVALIAAQTVIGIILLIARKVRRK